MEFRAFFAKDSETHLVYCSNIAGLVVALGLEYSADDWRLFIDSSNKSLKAVLLHNGNKVASVPLAHSVHLSESYNTMQILLSAIKYNHHQWKICGDLKVRVK